MATVIKAIFDGKVFRPQEPVDLKPNTTYTIAIESEPTESPDSNGEHVLTALGRLATDMGVTDLSIDHDVYAHGRLDESEHGD